jgi:hypothetical protein
MDSRIVAVPPYRRAGRPAKSRQPDEITYRIEGALASLPGLLSVYQDQQKVERGFRFLKDPLFMAESTPTPAVGCAGRTLCGLIFQFRIEGVRNVG